MTKYKIEDGTIVDVTEYSQESIDFFLTQYPEAELVQEEETQDFQNGAAEKDADVVPVATPSRASIISGVQPEDTESPSVDTSSELQEPKPLRGRAKTRRAELDRRDLAIEEKQKQEKEQSFFDDIFTDEPAYDKTKSFRAKRDKINQMAKDREELERKATLYSYNNMPGLESVAYIDNQLQEFDATAAKELEILNLDPEFKLRNDAIEQLSKNTGSNQGTGDGLEDTLSESNVLNVFRGKSYFKDVEASEIIDLNAEIEDAVVSKLDNKQLQKLSKGFYTLQEKENLLNGVKAPIVQKKIKEIEDDGEVQLVKTEDQINNFRKTQEAIVKSLNVLKNNPNITQENVDEYNLLVNKYKDIDAQVKNTVNNFEAYKTESLSKVNSLEGDFGIDLATGVINNNFKLTDKVEKFREKYSGDGWWNGTADIIGGELMQGAYQLLKKRYIGSATWLLTSFGDAFTDQENYSDFDAFSDVINNWSNKTILAKSEAEKFKITKKEGGFKDFDARNYAKLGVSMIPFTAQLISEVKKGKFTGLRSAIGKNYSKLGDKSKVLKDVSQQLKNNIIMADAAFRATIMDNQKEGEALGLNGLQASTFATVKSATEASVQLIMPDTQFLKGVTGKAIKDAFVGNLKKVANVEGAKSAVKEFSTNILKEYGEEQVNAAMNLVTDASYGLALPEASEFLNSQIELAAGTFMLSGGMSTVGASKTFSNQKKLIYNQIHDNITSLDLGLKTMQEASKNSENIAEIIKTRKFAKDIFKAVESSPENVTADQIDLLLEKQKLIKKKETTDSAFHPAINKKIEEVDAKIEDSSVKRDVAEQFDKDVVNVSKSLNSIGQKVDETLVLEDNEESSASDQMREILIKNNKSKEYAEENKDSYGAFITIDGKEVLVINKTSALSDSVVTTGQHEFLHKLLRASLSSNPEMITKAGQMLLKEIGQTVGTDSELISRINSYSSDADITSEKFFEEILPLFSEALTSKDVKLNESSLKKIGNFFRQVFQNAGLKKINFKTTEGVVNFIKDYNKAYSKGTFKGSLKGLASGSNIVDNVSLSKKVVELKEELDALDEFDFDDEFAFDAAKSNLENKIKTAERNEAKAKTESTKKPAVKKETLDKESKPKKVYDNENLIETIKSKDTSSKEKAAAEADLVDSFDTMALNAIKYDTRKGDYDRTEVRDYLRSFFPTILKSYNPSEAKFSTWVYNNIAPKAQQTYEKFKKIADKSLDAEAGTGGSVREAVADTSTTTEVATDKTSRKIKPIELVRNQESKNKYREAIKNIVESGEVSIDKSTFGNLKDLATEVTAEIFDIPVLKVTDPADNLTYKDVIVDDSNINKIKKYYPDAKVGMVIKSESSKIQDVIKSMGTDLFKLLPPENVSPELATVDAQAYKPVKGTGLKIPSSLMKVFYEATGKRSKGVTSQTAIKRLKPGLTYEQFLKDLGIVKGQPNTYDRAIGQRLKAITTLFGKLATNTEVRQLEGVTDVQKQNIEAGKSDVMFSKKKPSNESNVKKVLVKNSYKSVRDALAKEGIEQNPGISIRKGSSLVRKYLNLALEDGSISFEEAVKKETEINRNFLSTVFEGREWLFGLFSDKKTINNGIKYEKYIKKAISSLGLKQVNVNLSEGGFGSGVDLVLSIGNENINIELKLNEKAQMGSFTIKINKEGISYTKGVDGLETSMSELDADIKTALNSEEYKNNYKKYIEEGLLLGGSINEKSGALEGTKQMFDKLKKKKLLSKLNIDIETDQNLVDLIYNNKDIYNMDIGGKGLYYLGENKNNLNVPRLKGKVNLLIRSMHTQIGSSGKYRSSVRAFPSFKSSIENSNINLSESRNIEKNINSIVNSVKLSKSIIQASKSNNNMLPKSQKLKGDFTNDQVLDKMRELDDKQREAQISFSKKFNLDKDFNDIIENKTGIAAAKTYGKVKAEVVGASKGKFDFFIAPTAEDFVGLLYKTLGKGKKGDAQMAWYKTHLLDPFARAMNNVSRDRVTMGRDFKALKKDLKIVPKDLKKRLPGEYFTKEQAVRVYIWEQTGADVPGLSEADKKTLVDIVKDDPNLVLFANEVMKVNKGIEYAKPSENWVSGTITTDLTEGLNSVKRKQYLELWQQNVDEIFSEKNLNKLEAAYGKSYRYALEGTLKRMKTGRNRTFGTDSLTGRFLDWINGTTGAIMFFNSRSAVLQTISMANFINFEDNNVFAASKAFANQKQYWSDFKMLFNSDFLVERRDGLKLNVQESDIADIAKERGARGVIGRILKLGFTPTQLADSFAIASGGSTFYRNRLNKLIKEGMDPLAAKKQAMRDFRETAEESQQSSRPDKISQQQAGPLGRTVLAFANTPAQYARIMKKAASDIKNGRGDFKTNVSKIMYYGFVQNLIFNTLTNALFAIEFGEDEEKENEKYVSVANGMADSILRGIGVSGAIVTVLKNAALTFVREDKKKNPNYEKVVDDLLRISPPIASKASKIKSASRSYKWDKKEMGEKGFSLDNPAYLAGANVVSAATNLPLDRVVKKMDHVRAASNSELETYKRIFLLAGWSKWDLGIKEPKKSKKKNGNFGSGGGFSSKGKF